VDPLEVFGQKNDFEYFRSAMFPDAKIIVDYSERAISTVGIFGKPCKLLHIDGGHKKENVIADFLLYSPLMGSEGVIVFDDYNDNEHSPEVKLSVDMLLANGFFENYYVYGSIWGFDASFVVQKK
jgi:hypothetical protein